MAGRFRQALARLGPASRRVASASSEAQRDAKASATGALIAFDSLHQPVWSPRDYAAFAREGFMQNAVVYRCVRMIGEAAASVPLLLYDGDHEIEDHPLLDLVRHPNATQCKPDLLETWYGFLLVSGNAYLEAVAIGDRLRELHALRPDRVKVVPGPDGWPEAYDYSVAGRSIRLGGEAVPGVRSVLHLKLFHPVNDHYGLSPIEAASTAIDIHNAASRWNKALLDNSARPSGALVYTQRDSQLSSEQYERLKRELELGFQGAANAGRPLLLEGGLDWKSMSLSPKDMDFIDAKHAAAREIALALGVPPMLLGIPGDNTYSNYAEANRAFWRQTVLPLVVRTGKALSSWLTSGYVAAVRTPWPGAIAFYRSPETSGFTLRTLATAPATLGLTLDPLPAGPEGRIDHATRVRVRLDHGSLQSVSELALLAGANAAAIQGADGRWEIAQFQSATLIAEMTYELSVLLRGQAGSELAMASPLAAGARFVLIDAAIAPVTQTADDIGLPFQWRFGPVSDDIAAPTFAQQTFTFRGVGRLPLSPVHIRGRRLAGDLTLSWVRRTRSEGDGWDSLEVPLAEEAERYEVDVLSGSTVVRTLSATSPSVLYTAAAQTADFGSPQSSIALRVCQISATAGRGHQRAATL